MMISSRSVSLAALAVAAFAMGCGGSDPKPAENPQPPPGYQGYPQQGAYPQQQYPQQQYPQQQYPQQQPVGQPGMQPQPGQPAQPGQPQPGQPDLLGQLAAAGAAIMSPTGLAGDPIEAAIRAEAGKSAPGMTAEGQPIKDTLAADGRKDVLITLQGGKCYTIIGVSPAGQIKDLDLRLLMPPLYNLPAGQDGTASSTAIIGKGNNPTCPLTPIPVQYKLEIHAKNGAGQFGVQVFSRNR